MIDNKKILLFGGTGSLGYEFVKKYIGKNIIYNYSRDECKHWKMKLDFNNNKNLNFIIGDIINNNKIEETILRVKPNIIIIASAMKHIDQCEYNTDQSLNTNLLGVKNILDLVEKHQTMLGDTLQTVLFVSSDKACSPINVYGMCKALSETLVKDLVELFSEKYNKPIKITGIKPGEKLLESLINKSQSGRIKINGKYTHIKSIYDFNESIDESSLNDYNSKINPLNKEELRTFLFNLNLL